MRLQGTIPRFCILRFVVCFHVNLRHPKPSLIFNYQFIITFVIHFFSARLLAWVSFNIKIHSFVGCKIMSYRHTELLYTYTSTVSNLFSHFVCFNNFFLFQNSDNEKDYYCGFWNFSAS